MTDEKVEYVVEEFFLLPEWRQRRVLQKILDTGRRSWPTDQLLKACAMSGALGVVLGLCLAWLWVSG